MGISQGFALLPGISRSGSTLTCGLLLGLDKQETLDFSFLMSIPIILASAAYETMKLFSCQIMVNWLEIFCVMISSFVFGILPASGIILILPGLFFGFIDFISLYNFLH